MTSDGYEARTEFRAANPKGMTLNELRDIVRRTAGQQGDAPVRVATTWRGTTIKRLTVLGVVPTPDPLEGTNE